MRIIAAAAALLLCSAYQSSVHAEVAKQCPYEYSTINNICALVSNQIEDPDKESAFLYMYQSKMYEAACVTDADSSEVKISAFRELWRRHGDKFICQSLGITRARVLKVAVIKNFSSYVQDAVEYNLRINEIDPIADETVLDYISKELKKAQSPAIKSNLQSYYTGLRAAGALHFEELKGGRARDGQFENEP